MGKKLLRVWDDLTKPPNVNYPPHTCLLYLASSDLLLKLQFKCPLLCEAQPREGQPSTLRPPAVPRAFGPAVI